MKRNKFSEFINSRGQYAAVFVFMIAVGICAGVAALNGSEDKAVEENTALNEPETPSVSEPVLTEKNAPRRRGRKYGIFGKSRGRPDRGGQRRK